METDTILKAIEQGRTDLIFDLIVGSEWPQVLDQGGVKPLQWLVYYDDATALEAVIRHGGSLASIDLDSELGNAAFFGHWKVCDFLLRHGADAQSRRPDTHETPLHNALAKAGRPYFLYTVRLLVENGADVNAKTLAGVESGAFMRDVRTKGETPLHRAAVYGDEDLVQFLLDHGADREARDAHGDSPLSWASEHLRPARILSLLSFGSHQISPAAERRLISDHGAGWGNGMEWNLIGDYLPFTSLTDGGSE